MSKLVRRRRRTLLSLPGITLTPLIDTALTLLIIFMVTTPMMHNAIKVNLPKGHAQEDTGVKHELVLYIDAKEQLFFNPTPNASPIKREELIQELQKRIGAEINRTVFVKADESVRYGHVIEIVDQIKVVGGVSTVALATEKRA